VDTSPKLVRFINDCCGNRLAWILVFLHATWFFLAIANMSPPSRGLAQFLQGGGWSSATLFAGRPFHFEYESIPMKLLFLADLPSALAAILLDFAKYPLARLFHFNFYTDSYVAATELLLIATFQWLLLGWAIDGWLVSKRRGTWLLQKVNRHFVIIISFIVLFALITTPIVNQRSRELGFRHGAISFH
jgi:hypothetical protein